MTAKVDTKLPYALISKYESLYKKSTGRSASLNKFKEKWAAIDIIDSFGYDRSVAALELMFSTGKTSWTFFTRNCDQIIKYQDSLKEDMEERLERRKQIEEWANESTGS